MNSIHVLLVENSPILQPSLQQSLGSIENQRFKIESVDTTLAELSYHFAKRPTDVVLFGDKLGQAAVLRLARAYRAQGNAGHIIWLTRQSEPRVSPTQRKAGIDDVLNVMEIATPVFGWTFVSALHSAGIKKKAEEYEVIQERLQLVNNALGHLAESIGEPLGNLRQVAAQIGKNGHSKVKPSALKNQLTENLVLIESYLVELQDVRARLCKETRVINKVLQKK